MCATLAWDPKQLILRTTRSVSIWARRHLFLSKKEMCLLVEREDMYSCWTRRHVFLFNRKTYLFVVSLWAKKTCILGQQTPIKHPGAPRRLPGSTQEARTQEAPRRHQGGTQEVPTLGFPPSLTPLLLIRRVVGRNVLTLHKTYNTTRQTIKKDSVSTYT